MQTKTSLFLLVALASASAIGCGSGGSSGERLGTARAALHRAKSCGDLLDDLRADAAFKMNRSIDAQIRSTKECIQYLGDEACGFYSGSYPGPERGYGEAPSAGADDAATAPPSASPSDPGEGASSYSETNTQVGGVDEADIVKNDGKYLYVLHGRAFKVIQAWPATELAEASAIDIEGSPTEMFVADGKVVVYSVVNGTDVFAAAGVTPKQGYSDFGYGYGYGGGVSVDAASPMPYPTSGPYAPLTKITVLTLAGTTPSVAREVYFEGNYLSSRRVGSHVRTVLQSHQYGPQLKRGIYELFEPTVGPDGSYSQPDYPQTGTETIAALEKLRSDNLATLNATKVEDWLPYTFVKDGDAINAKTVACEDFYVPTTGSTESGLTEVASLDLSDPAAVPRETAILGHASTVYASADTLYLAARGWVEPPYVSQYGSGGSAGSGSSPPLPPDDWGTVDEPSGQNPNPPPEAGGGPDTPPGDPKPPTPGLKPASLRALDATDNAKVVAWSPTVTHVHKFEFATDAGFPNYVASGTVPGTVHNQFSLDDKDGRLRIATTEDRQYVTTDGQYVYSDSSPPRPGVPPPARPGMVNHLYVLEEQGPWLEIVGDVGDLAPNERIYSARFVGNRGYMVTFRQVDPLFVVDLSNPAQPTLLGELKIPGFSEYMHPLDDNHLLTIGRNADDMGRQEGLQLQIFDVTDGANPIQKHVFTYSGDEYGASEAEYDHKAFTYFADKKLLAFPYYAYDSQDGTMRSSLELFKVDLGAGFTKVGSIDHTALFEENPYGYCGGYYRPSVRRGVFLENFVYSVSYGGVVVKDANDLLAPGPELAFSSPEINEGYGPACY